MKQHSLFRILSIATIFLAFMLIGCGNTQDPLEYIVLKRFQAAEVRLDSRASVVDAVNIVVKDSNGILISTEDIKPGDVIYIIKDDPNKDAFFIFDQPDGATTYYTAVREGEDACPVWWYKHLGCTSESDKISKEGEK